MAVLNPERTPIKELLKACTVKLTDPAGKLLGTGFFVTPRKLATCRHVFFNRDRLAVQVFCIEGQDAQFEVQPNYQAHPQLDLVMIDLGQEISERSVDLKAETNWQSQPLWAWTYSDGYPDGAGIVSDLKEAARHNGMDVYRISRDAFFSGSSGTPVLSEDNRFIGIVYWVKEREIGRA
ncbi:serine protease, partial [Arthrospira platensis SPKY1]|nr:serine protease [Arthrospira platensis SPKY1]